MRLRELSGVKERLGLGGREDSPHMVGRLVARKHLAMVLSGPGRSNRSVAAAARVAAASQPCRLRPPPTLGAVDDGALTRMEGGPTRWRSERSCGARRS